MDKLNLPEIIRASILQYKVEGRLSNDKGEDLEKVLHLMIIDKYRIYDDAANDLKQEALLNLLGSFQKNIEGFWSEVIELTEENDKRIIAYVYSIIRTAFRVSNDKFEKRESINLDRNLREVCNELVQSGNLKSNQNNYHLAGASNLERCSIEIGSSLFIIRNKDGSINKQKLKELVSSLFEEELEKFEVSFSDLLRIITSITDIGLDKMVSISDKFIEDDESGSIELTLTSEDSFNNPEALADAGLLTEQWYRKLDNIYNEDELRLKSELFVLKYGYNLTLFEIANMIPDKLSKSSVDNYIKEFIRLSGMNFDIELDDPLTGFYIEAFILFLNDKYKI